MGSFFPILTQILKGNQQEKLTVLYAAKNIFFYNSLFHDQLSFMGSADK